VSSESLLEMGWELPPGVRAACTTRLGGVSTAPWDSFNLATHVGDNPEHVATNRARLRELLGLGTEPAWLSQVHGIEVAHLDAEASFGGSTAADASVTSSPGIVSVVMVADCLPVLFTTRDGSRVGTAHAGWRGLAAGVLERTVRAIGVPGNEIRAWLGPCISREYFEVGDEVREEFVRKYASAPSCFERNSRGRWQADLIGLARHCLETLGVHDVSGGKWCTYGDGERFFSHRRDANCGRIAALVWLQRQNTESLTT
jgi:polyphenol oxidase